MVGRMRSRAGFTLIEILTVIGVIALLVGLLFPALGAARRKAIKSTELNDLRQVGMAWQMYANHNNDAVLPGYLDAAVQKLWKVKYDNTDDSPVLPAPDYSPSDPNVAGPWTWRLMPYLSYSHELIHRYADEDDTSPLAMESGYAHDPDGLEYDPDVQETDAEVISTTPAFAYNAYHMGGWWNEVETIMVPLDGGGFEPHKVARALFDNAVDSESGHRVGVIARSVGSIRRSAHVITFCSAAPLEPGIHKYSTLKDQMAGSHFVAPPYLPSDQVPGRHNEIWRSTNIGGGSPGAPEPTLGLTARYDADPNTIEVTHSLWSGTGTPVRQGVPFGRYNGNVALLFADGHTDQQSPSFRRLAPPELPAVAPGAPDFYGTVDPIYGSYPRPQRTLDDPWLWIDAASHSEFRYDSP